MEYQESPYVILQNSDYELRESTRNCKVLIWAIITLHLTQGFQIIIGSRVTEAIQGRGGKQEIYGHNYMGTLGLSCFMSHGTWIHQLIYDKYYNIEVKQYICKPANALQTKKYRNDEYTSYIKMLLKPTYSPVRINFHQPVSDYNWNYADKYITSYKDILHVQLQYWYSRFVLIPVELPESANHGQITSSSTELNDEEVHLEGIRWLTMIFQCNYYISPDKHHYECQTNPLHASPSCSFFYYCIQDPLIEGPQHSSTYSFIPPYNPI
jgi:hypothetical protein